MSIKTVEIKMTNVSMMRGIVAVINSHAKKSYFKTDEDGLKTSQMVSDLLMDFAQKVDNVINENK